MTIGVSYVVPVFNKADCIAPVLRQIARQQGDFTKQYVFVNDGSTDGSLEIVQELTRDWNNTVIVSQSNRGAANATNRAISLVTQPYIKFVDADDQLTERATSVLLQALIGTDACLSYGQRERIGSGGECVTSEANPLSRIEKESLKLTIKRSHFNPSQCLAKTDAVRAVGGCDERVAHAQEYSLSLRLAYHWPFVRVDTPVVWIPRNVVQRISEDQGGQLKSSAILLKLFFEDYPDVSDELKLLAARRVTGRAWKYARRHKGATFFSKWFGLYVFVRVGGGGKSSILRCIEKCYEAFD